jgi:hypothetical protein
MWLPWRHNYKLHFFVNMDVICHIHFAHAVYTEFTSMVGLEDNLEHGWIKVAWGVALN